MEEFSDESQIALNTIETHREVPSFLSPAKAFNMNQQNLVNWLLEYAPVVSGHQTLRRLRFTTRIQAWNEYQSAMHSRRASAYEYSQFCKLLDKWYIHSAVYDKCACPYCYAYEKATTEDKPIHPEIENHLKLKAATWEKYHEYTRLLPLTGSGKCAIMTMDYCRIHQVSEKHEHEEQGQIRTDDITLSIFNMIVVLNKSEQHPFDLLSTLPQSPAFMRSAFHEFAQKIAALIADVEELIVWSDGGLQTYGTVSSLYELHKMLKKRILHFLFAPYHGHNRSDGHFGRIKTLLKQKYSFGNLAQCKFDPDDPTPAEKLLQISNSVKNTEAFLFEFSDVIVRENYRKWESQQKGVTEFNVYRYDNERMSACVYNDNNQMGPWFVIHPPPQVKPRAEKKVVHMPEFPLLKADSK